MTREFTKNRLSPKRAASPAAPVAASALARQAARELLTPDLPNSAEENALGLISGPADGFPLTGLLWRNGR
jgi:hypothetical protein